MASKTPEAQREHLALAVARGMSLRAAARSIGVSESTGRRLAASAGFDDLTRKLLDKIIGRAVGRLAGLALKAAGRLGKLIDSPNEEVALKAARGLLQDMATLRDHTQLAERLGALEERADASAPHSRKAW